MGRGEISVRLFTIHNWQFAISSLHCPKRRIDIRIIAAKPVAEAAPQELAGGRRRTALQDPMLSVEEIGGVDRIGGHGLEARVTGEDCRGPFPTVADEVMDAPRRRPFGERSDRGGIPRTEVEVAVAFVGRVLAPRIEALGA